MNFCTLPVIVVGNESLKSQYFGTLKYESYRKGRRKNKYLKVSKAYSNKVIKNNRKNQPTRCLQNSFSSSSVTFASFLHRTHAQSSSPSRESGTPITYNQLYTDTK